MKMIFFVFLAVVTVASVLSHVEEHPEVLEKPSSWSCSKPTDGQNIVPACIQSSSFDGMGGGSISSILFPGNAQDMCIVLLDGGEEFAGDFYITATLSNGATDGAVGPFAGLLYNYDPTSKTGNYVLARLGLGSNQVEAGVIVDNQKTFSQTASSQTVYSEITNDQNAGFAKLGILRQNGGTAGIYVNNNIDEALSAVVPVDPPTGAYGFLLQNVQGWNLVIENLEICTPIRCEYNGNTYEGGQFWDGEDGKTCQCTESGAKCECGDDSITCTTGTKWTDPVECESRCIPAPGYCGGTGDPHYTNFDNKYFDFHGQCTYQAASCGDFQVYFKNIDFHGRAPRYSRRIEVVFGNQVFTIEAGNVAQVDGGEVQVPYVKNYRNGDRIEIKNNGQLEILLYSKGREPSVRVRATNYGTWINAEMWLHGSCAEITEGLCGNWNGNPNDDMTGGSPNSLGELWKKYDEHCPPPPEPYHPCDVVGHDAAEDICSVLNDSPFDQCHAKVPVGDRNGGVIKDCMTDLCECWLDLSCACATYDAYSTECINQQVDLSDWRKDVWYCPYDCPGTMVYKAKEPSPAATCLEQNPIQDETARGCFCPDGQFLQDGECVESAGCKCLYLGQFYENGNTIVKEAECEECTCEDGGNMNCEAMVCETLACNAGELTAFKEDKCCPYCSDSWVEAVNPVNKLSKGHKVVLTCAIHTEGVKKKDIKWYNPKGKKVKKGISNSRLTLTLENVDANDGGEYKCTAKKDGVTGEAIFNVEVVLPKECTHTDGNIWEEGTIYKPQPTEECTCDGMGQYKCECIDDMDPCVDPTPLTWFDKTCMKTCLPEPGFCFSAADENPQYITFDGTKFGFEGVCAYKFFSCGDLAIYADHKLDEQSGSVTKSFEIVFREDKIELSASGVIELNGVVAEAPLHITYKDGSVLSIGDVGHCKLRIEQDGKDPLLELIWDKEDGYSIEVHGSCKGLSSGLCGQWNDDFTDDFTMPDGEVAIDAEEFGTSWAVDDEDDCPKPLPPPDMCDFFGLDKFSIESRVEAALEEGKLKDCSDDVDNTAFVEIIAQEICACGGDLSCSCAPIEQFAIMCQQRGYDTAGWQIDNGNCDIPCPIGSVFKIRGPKPAPSCFKPGGGRKSQKGCFCPQGEVMEAGECIKIENCQCEYAGVRYDVGTDFKKEAECKECFCKGPGEESCSDIVCIAGCLSDEIEVKVEDKCCPECLKNWVTSLDPELEGIRKEELSMTCQVTGVEVVAADVKWFKFNPGMKDVTNLQKKYDVSDDGLELTIKKLTDDTTGNYKCVVEKNGAKSEATTVVSLPLEPEELIEAKEEQVSFVPGRPVTIEVEKLNDEITKIVWKCGGKKMVNGKNRARIENSKTTNSLTLDPSEVGDAGSCTCYAKGVGTQDEVTITLVEGEGSDIKITRKKSALVCNAGQKRRCVLKFKVTSKEIKKKDIVKANARICKLVGGRQDCEEPKGKRGNFKRKFRNPSTEDSGQYVLVYNDRGVETESAAITLAIN